MTAAESAALPGGPDAVRPFAGLLVAADWAEQVVAPMLDAIPADKRAAFGAAHQNSWWHVRAGSGERAPVEGQPSGRAALRRLLDGGAFVDIEPGVFVYRIADRLGTHTGVVVEVAASAFVDGGVRGHEAVRPDRVEALVQHLQQVPVRSELVALLRARDDDIDGMVARACSGVPLLDFSTEGLRQSVWRVEEPDADLIRRSLAAGPLYVADGHHRVAASLEVWEKARRPATPGLPCVVYAPDGLRLESFHRRVRGPIDVPALLAELRGLDRAEDTDGPLPTEGVVAVYAGNRWLAVPLPRQPGVRRQGVANLDVARLQAEIIGPLLGVAAVGDDRLEVAPATDPLASLVARCDDDGGVLFVLAPPSVAALVDVADRHEAMLPKSTFFEPKPQAGIFLQPLDG